MLGVGAPSDKSAQVTHAAISNYNKHWFTKMDLDGLLSLFCQFSLSGFVDIYLYLPQENHVITYK